MKSVLTNVDRIRFGITEFLKFVHRPELFILENKRFGNRI
jgi:hypothetical protein